MLTGVTRPFHAPHALFTPSTGGLRASTPRPIIRLIRSRTRVCAQDVTDDVTSLPLRSLFLFSVPVTASSIGTLERCAASTLRASLTICSHSVK